MTQANRLLLEKLKGLRERVTKGPWEYTGEKDGDFIVWGASPDDEFIANVDESSFVPVPPMQVAFDINKPNAALIALAPEMMDYILALPAYWFEDSSLETWFPFTAKELEKLKAESAASVNEELAEALRKALDLIFEHHELGFIRRTAEKFGGSCELCKDSRYLNIGKVLEKYDREAAIARAEGGK